MRILPGLIATSNEDLSKKINKISQNPKLTNLTKLRAGSGAELSKNKHFQPCKTRSVLIRISVRKHKDSLRIFEGDCLLCSAMFIS
jgi:hypothetical protein